MSRYNPLDRFHHISILYEPFALKIMAVEAECQRAGIRLFHFETYRHPLRQDMLYAQGRENTLPKVTNARGGHSWHQYGLAVDFAFKEPDGRWHWEGDVDKAVEIIREESGLVWGGPHDRLHFQHPATKHITISEAMAICKIGNGWGALFAKIDIEGF